MTELWYWRSNERIRGPLVTEELEALVVNDRLAAGDAVRLDGSDEWISASEIRQLFLRGSDNSPAETAAKLLQSAAARRLQGTALAPQATVAGGFFGRLSGATGELAGAVVELLVRAVEACTRWLGRRGRLIVTLLAGVAVVAFLFTRWGGWGVSDSTRLQRLEAVWKHLQVSADSNIKPARPVDPEITRWLATTHDELETALRNRPVSGSAGSARKSALASREMLFAVREIRDHTAWDETTRNRIDRALDQASNYLAGSTATQPAPAPRPSRESSGSHIVTVFLIFDGLVGILIVVWWIAARRRS